MNKTASQSQSTDNVRNTENADHPAQIQSQSIKAPNATTESPVSTTVKDTLEKLEKNPQRRSKIL
ncbi:MULTISPECIES: hypothetical protein [unclassified Psychrobacter]|uniref:hypothetical protein n=1 Tax=unclassified Psychrobacter TaxID=196806 RepID=UPI003FB7712B